MLPTSDFGERFFNLSIQVIPGNPEAIEINPVAWAEAQLGITLAPWQREVLTSDAQRLLLLTPRQCGKTTVIAALAAVTMKVFPGTQVAIISPTARQSGFLSAKVGDLLRSERIVQQSSTALTLANGSGLASLPGDRPDTVRGLTASLLLIDEASRVKSELIASAMPMTAASNGRTILLSTPAGASGSFYDYFMDDSGDWVKKTVTLGDATHYSQKELKALRRRLGERMWQQEMEAKFLERPGALFSIEQVDAIFGGKPVGWLPTFLENPDYKESF